MLESLRYRKMQIKNYQGYPVMNSSRSRCEELDSLTAASASSLVGAGQMPYQRDCGSLLTECFDLGASVLKLGLRKFRFKFGA